MVVLKVRIPGARLRLADERTRAELENFVQLLLWHLGGAVTAYNFVLVATSQATIDEGMAGHQAREARRRGITDDLARESSTGQEGWSEVSERASEVKRRLREEDWASLSTIRGSDWNHLGSLCRRAYVFDLYTFRELAEDLRDALKGWCDGDETLRADLSRACGAARELVAVTDAVFPRLRKVRDTLHHLEERGRGLKRDKKGRTKPIKLATQPGGGTRLNLGSADSTSFTVTVADGSEVTVPVDPNSLQQLTHACERLLDTLPWEGPVRFEVI